jgi:hypothetical protein
MESALDIRFLLVVEGSSDRALRIPLEKLCFQCGADEVHGVAPDLRRFQSESRTVEDKVRKALKVEPDVDVIFVHRDADSPDPSSRFSEIDAALESIDQEKPWVSVIPIQATEAWALVDEEAIRRASENPNGSVPLDVPSPNIVESITNPKDRLFDLMIEASEYSGRRLSKFKQRIHKKRFFLIEKLDINGPLCRIPAWRNLTNQLSDTLSKIASASSDPPSERDHDELHSE